MKHTTIKLQMGLRNRQKQECSKTPEEKIFPIPSVMATTRSE